MTATTPDYRGSATAWRTLPNTWIENVETWLLNNWELFDPSHAHRMFWPDRPYKADMDILVAGSGPGQAAVIAYNNPQSRVTAIDVDEAALNHETYLRHKHMLLNLDARTLHPLPVEQVTGLNKTFDLIIASGVLQYAQSPEAGMKALADVLRPNGSLAVMLPSQHLVDAPDLDAGGSYRTFSAMDCLELVEGAGLVFQDWFHKTPYYPPGLVKTDDEFTRAISVLPEPQMWSVMDSLRNQSGRHLFMACRRERAERSYRIDFSAARAADYVPQGRPNAAISGPMIVRPGCSILLEPSDLAMAREADGERSIRAIAERAGSGVSDAVEFFKQLWRMDFIAINLPA